MLDLTASGHRAWHSQTSLVSCLPQPGAGACRTVGEPGTETIALCCECELQKGVVLVGSLLDRGLLGEVISKLYGAMGSKFTCAAKSGEKKQGMHARREHPWSTRLFLWFLAFFCNIHHSDIPSIKHGFFWHLF